MVFLQSVVVTAALVAAQVGPVVQRPDAVAPVTAPAAGPTPGALVPEPGGTAPPPAVATPAPEPVSPAPTSAPPPEPAPPEPAMPAPEPIASEAAPEVADAPPQPAALSDEELYEQSEIDAAGLATERSLELQASRANAMIAAGALSGVASVLMLVMAGVEASKPECDFGLSRCDDAPRPAVARGLGITGAVLAVGGGALIGVGIRRLRRIRAGVTADDRGAGLVLSGRF